MECVFSAPNSAYPALLAVKDTLLLGVIIVKGADRAVVIGKVLLAPDASFGLFLFCVTAQAFNVGHFVPIERVIELVVSDSLPLLVVAQATRVKPALANGVGTLFVAGASVVFAS